MQICVSYEPTHESLEDDICWFSIEHVLYFKKCPTYEMLLTLNMASIQWFSIKKLPSQNY
jgi:hypothetical protein